MELVFFVFFSFFLQLVFLHIILNEMVCVTTQNKETGPEIPVLNTEVPSAIACNYFFLKGIVLFRNDDVPERY